MYITSDICKGSYYGNKSTNLLRIVEIPKGYQFGDQITCIYDNPYYLPLRKNIFNKIKVNILHSMKDDNQNNNKVPFKFGTFYLTLHLRKVNNTVKITTEPPPNEEKEVEGEVEITLNKPNHPWD